MREIIGSGNRSTVRSVRDQVDFGLQQMADHP